MSTKKDKFTSKDKQFMQIALNLAIAREGLTGTNPSVGCVIVKNNKIISIGQTSYDGRPHAERNAIKDSIENVAGSKMYVTLEPCCHKGKTPPCTNLIIKSKISEVIYSISDIDERVSGKSFKVLKSSKIKVRKNLLKKEISRFYYPYFFNRKNKIPFVTGKIAVSKNNLIYSKEKQKITNIYSDKFSHFLRYKNDTILISYKTLNKDNPKLSCRLKNKNNFSPIRVILDSKLNSNPNSYLIKSASKIKTIIFYNEATKSKLSLFKSKKVLLIKSKINKNKEFKLKEILKKLYSLGSRNLLVEGGDKLTKSFINDKIFNKFYLFKSSNNLSKNTEFVEFNSLNTLKSKYRYKSKLNLKLKKDKIELYKNYV